MTGADGIGLFRTEFQFLVSATLPGRERQQRLYRKVLEAAGDKPVIFRTVDIGGDKALPYLHRRSTTRPRTRRWAGARCASRSSADPDEGAGARADRGGRRQGPARHVPDGLRAVGV